MTAALTRAAPALGIRVEASARRRASLATPVAVRKAVQRIPAPAKPAASDRISRAEPMEDWA